MKNEKALDDFARLIDLVACLGLVITEADDRGFYQDQCNEIYRDLPDFLVEKIEAKEEYYKTELNKPEVFKVLSIGDGDE